MVYFTGMLLESFASLSGLITKLRIQADSISPPCLIKGRKS